MEGSTGRESPGIGPFGAKSPKLPDRGVRECGTPSFKNIGREEVIWDKKGILLWDAG